MGFTPIEDYGVIGNLETCPLIGRDGSIDWCCFPHIESSSVFASLLDDDGGGHFAIQPSGEFESEQEYVTRTNVLRTTFETDSGTMVLTDFMPVVDGTELETVDTGTAPVSTALHALGMPGRTAYVGTVDIGRAEPGDTVVVSAAAGAVGSVAGQIARIAGCRVVGITGRDEKADWLTNDLGFDAAINYRTADDLSAAVADACPRGVDLYFENVGGEVTDAVMEHLVDHSRVAVCGKIALYNVEDDDDRLRGPRHLHQRTRTRVEGFIVSDHADRFDHINARLRRWVEDDQLQYRETVTDGIENAADAFLGLFDGTNIGKQLVRIDAD